MGPLGRPRNGAIWAAINSKQITVLVDRLRALESALVEAKANGSRMANNIRGGIVNLRHVMETIYEPLGGKANVQKRLENAYKGVGNRRGMVENMFKRAKFPNATALANEFKAILSDLDGLRPALEKAIL